MTPDQYVESVLSKYAVARGPNSPSERLAVSVTPAIQSWAGQQLNIIQFSGSYAKETAVRGTSDVDLLISLKSDTTNSLKEIFNSLYDLANRNTWSPRKQNVSIRITINGTLADLVPAKVQSGYQNYHSLYLCKRDSWTQTNVTLHVEKVRNSRRLCEIRAIKIWRLIHNLDWPSLYLELFAIQSLSGRSQTSLSENVLHVLRTMEKSLTSTRIEDPSNTNNILSDELTTQEKQRIGNLAGQSVRKQNWGDIIS